MVGIKKVSRKNIFEASLWCIHIFLIIVFISFSMGCIAPEKIKDPGTEPKVVESKVMEPIVGGVAIGVSPRVILADRGENISFTVNLLSTENADDRVTISINDTWINENLTKDIKAGANESVLLHISVPLNAVNMSFSLKARSQNLNATSTTSGMILIRK